jgi:hypothetical protein
MSKRPIPDRKTRGLYPFLFFGTPDRGRDHQPWQARDWPSVVHLLPPLQERGYVLRDVVLNTPPKGGAAGQQLASVPVRPERRDVVLTTTRFPINDDPSDKKRVLRGHTEWEPLVLEAGSRVFASLSRRRSLLREHLWPLVRPGFEDRVNIVYRQRNGADFYELRTGARGRAHDPPAEKRTSAFLLNTRLGEDGPTLIAAFAMDGVAAIAWSQILARRHPDWLLEPGFTMVDLVRGPVPKRPTLLGFAPQWRMEIVLQTTL